MCAAKGDARGLGRLQEAEHPSQEEGDFRLKGCSIRPRPSIKLQEIHSPSELIPSIRINFFFLLKFILFYMNLHFTLNNDALFYLI